MSTLTRLSLRMGNPSASSSSRATSRLASISRHMSTEPTQPSNQKPRSTKPPSINYTEPSIIYSQEFGSRIYKLNRNKAYNALNHEMIQGLSSKLKIWRDSELCTLIIGVGGEKAFCAGGDVKQLVLDLENNQNTALPFFKDEFELNWLLARIGKPYVTIMDGITMGGGCGIALPASIRVATQKTHFAMPETKIGYAPDVGVNYYLAQLEGNIGAWLAITGQDIYGRAVYELGLATHYVNHEHLSEIYLQLSELPTPTLPKISNLMSSYSTSTPSPDFLSSKSTPDGRTPITGAVRVFLDKTFSQDSISKIYTSLEKAANGQGDVGEDVKVWAGEQKALMDLRSPTGMAVALEGFRRAKKSQRLDVTLQNDMSMATAFAGTNRPTDDFITGVNAVLISRSSGRPSWSPDTLTDPSLTPKSISSNFFTPPKDSSPTSPTLQFNPKPTSRMSDPSDSSWGQFRKYGLPSENDVESFVIGSSPSSGAFKVTERELMERLLESRGESAGGREGEVREWVKGILKRCCEVKDGYLDWKGRE